MISEDLPRARVLIYGYDLSSTAAISEHARHLLEKLTNARKTCPERPILFVAHSLGGVILKQVSDSKLVLYKLTNRRQTGLDKRKRRMRILRVIPRNQRDSVPQCK